MQQTENYKLNLIETSDPFSPNPLNANTQVFDQVMAAVASEQHLFKLAETRVVETGDPLDVDLSGVDLTQYDAMLMFCHLHTGSGSRYMKINDIGSAAVIYSNADKSADQLAAILFFPVGDTVVTMSTYVNALVVSSGTQGGSGTIGGKFDIPWADVRTLNISSGVGSRTAVFGIKF